MNQTKNRDREFVVTKTELAARAAAAATWSGLLGFDRAGTAVGVPDLVDRATLDEFLGDSDSLIIAVYSRPKVSDDAGLKHAQPVPPSPGLSAFHV